MAKRGKINPNQRSFDFEAAEILIEKRELQATLAEQLDAEIQADLNATEEGENHENKTIPTAGGSGQSINRRDDVSYSQAIQTRLFQSPRIQDSGHSGLQRTGESESVSNSESFLFDENQEDARKNDRYSDRLSSLPTTSERASGA